MKRCNFRIELVEVSTPVIIIPQSSTGNNKEYPIPHHQRNSYLKFLDCQNSKYRKQHLNNHSVIDIKTKSDILVSFR